jgi:hypothetical protein
MPAPVKPIRWNVEQAAGEFGRDRKTVAKLIRTAGIEPGEDGRYSTRDIVAALFGDLRSETTREKKARANLLELEEEKQRGRLLDAEQVYRAYESVFIVLRQKILASTSLLDDEKDEFINECRGLKAKVITN